MREQKLTFRQSETKFVMNRWRAAESCSLVGVGSIGKSNLMHHIANQAVAAHYLSSSSHYAVIIDANMLGALPSWNQDGAESFRCWAGYELLMHRLYLDFYPLKELDADAENFFETYQALQDGTNPLFQYMGIRYLELGLEFFARRNIKIMFMFDEFEELLKQMPARFFLALRGLRDRHKSSITYLTFSRMPIRDLIDEMGLPLDDYEPFFELFSDNVQVVGPYVVDDAVDMLNNLQKRHQVPLDPDMTDQLVQITGGYAGLIRAVYHSLLSMPESDRQSETINDTLLQNRSVQIECETLWRSLSVSEQKILLIFAKNPNEIPANIMTNKTQRAIEILAKKNLLQVNPSDNRIITYPPLFSTFIKKQFDVMQ